MAKQNITDRWLKSKTTPPGDYWDTGFPGFGVRVAPTGRKTFVYAARFAPGRHPTRRAIGVYPKISLEKARERAREWVAMLARGADPKVEARRAATAVTVADVLDRFIADHADRVLKPKTAFDYRRIVEKLLKPHLGHLPIRDITTSDVSTAYQAMRTKPTQAALAIRVLSSAMSFAEQWNFRDPGSNPARIRVKGSRRRERLFSESEVARLLHAIDDLESEAKISRPIALGLRLLFATGCRAGEILALEWQNVEFDEGVMRWPDSKTGYLEKPITDEIRSLLKNADRVVGLPWVCPSPNNRQMRLETLEIWFRTSDGAGQGGGEGERKSAPDTALVRLQDLFRQINSAAASNEDRRPLCRSHRDALCTRDY